MLVLQKISDVIKPYGRVFLALWGFVYDIQRFFLYSAWRSDMKDTIQRNYHMVKIYHALEKSMSFRVRREGSGWSSVYQMLDVLKYSEISKTKGFHDRAAVSVLAKFLKMDENKQAIHATKVRKVLDGLPFYSEAEHGTTNQTLKDFRKGVLASPEDFFLSRYSLREFQNKSVSRNVIKRAVELAMKTPSVCNRQPWHVYHADDKRIINAALSFQNGNRGFGHAIPNLMVVTSDLKAFMSGAEHYQHWIDGGLFSMSLIYALHSLGVASCALNWSQSPDKDKGFRAKLNIQPSHTVILLLALGWPKKNNRVCCSTRRPSNEVLSSLTLR